MSDIRDDLRNLQTDLRALGSEIGDVAAARAVRAIRPAKEALEQITSRLEGATNGHAKIQVRGEDVRKVAAIALAAGAGAVVAGLMARR
jgi:hypothetical protein